MADASYAQTSFLGGEWSKFAQGRFDRPDYRTAMNVCLNFFPIEQGSCVRRPGTRHSSLTRAGQAARVLNFDFKQDLPYTLEFTSSFLRFRNGANLVTTNDDQLVTAISAASPAEVTVSGVHNWVTGNAVQFVNLGTSCPTLQNRLFNIISTGASKFTIVDAVTGALINGATIGALPAGVHVQRILEVVTPYSGITWRDVRLVQSETTAVLLHPTIPPQVLTASPAPVSTTALPPPAGVTVFTFTLAPAVFTDGPYLDPPTNGAKITPSGTSGIITISLAFSAYSATKAYQVGDFVLDGGVNYISIQDQNLGHTPAISPTFWTAISAGIAVGPNGFATTDIGRLIRMFDAANHWTWGKIVSIANLIDPGLAGSLNIGQMSGNGGLNAAFDGVIAQASGACAALFGPDPTTGQVGKNYGGAGGRKIAYGILWPSTDLGLVYVTKTFTTTTGFYQLRFVGASLGWVLIDTSSTTATVQTTVSTVIVNLRAKNTAPASPSDGTLLGSVVSPFNGGPITVQSNDQNTTWNFVWFEILATGVDLSLPPDSTGDPLGVRPGGPLSPPVIPPLHLGDTGYITTTVLNTYQISEFVAEAQFFTPPGTGAGNAVNVQLLGPDLASTASLGVWQLGRYSNTTGWPSSGTFHEGRLWLAGSAPNHMDGSVSNSIFNFTPTTVTGQVLDSSAISATFNAPDVNAIFWLVPDHLGIIVGTQGGDWLVQASANNNPLTPTSFQAHRYSRMPCANIEPRRADGGPLIVVPRYQRKIYEHFPDVYSGKFAAQNITQTMRHLTRPIVEEIAYQRELTPIIWARCRDGSLFGITYKRDSNVAAQLPNFAAGHRHALGSGRVVESITVGPSVDGALDTLTMVTNDPVTGLRHVELLTPLLEEGDPETAAWFLDDAVEPSSSLISGSNFVIQGLAHLEGKLVTVFAGGLNLGQWPVVNGIATLTFGDGVDAGTGGGLFTADFVNSFNGDMPLVVGFAYTSQGQIVRPATPAESGARNGPALGKKRRTHQFAVLLENTGPISFGTTFDKLLPAMFKSPGGTEFVEGQMFSGIYRNTLKDDYSFDSQLCWQVTGPYSATMCAIEGFLQTQDV